jgi:hypothetical protein
MFPLQDVAQRWEVQPLARGRKNNDVLRIVNDARKKSCPAFL